MHATPTDVAVVRGSVVVANGPQGNVEVFDSATGASAGVTQLTAAAPGALEIGGGEQGIWYGTPQEQMVADASGDLLPTGRSSGSVRIRPDSTSLTAVYKSFDGIAVAKRDFWVTGDSFGRTVWRIDRATRKVAAAIPLSAVPKAVAVGEGGVWVTSLLDDTVSRIDPAANRISATIRVPRGAYAIAAGGGGVWVTSAIDDVVARIDPATNGVVTTIPVGGTPVDLAADGSDVWVVLGER